MKEYAENTELLLDQNRRLFDSVEPLQQLRKRLQVDPNQSILGGPTPSISRAELYAGRKVLVVINPHGGSTDALRVPLTLLSNVDLGGRREALLPSHQHEVHLPGDQLRVAAPRPRSGVEATPRIWESTSTPAPSIPFSSSAATAR